MQPEHEREMLARAWISAGEVENMVSNYSYSAAKALNISRVGFIKMCLSNAVKE